MESVLRRFMFLLKKNMKLHILKELQQNNSLPALTAVAAHAIVYIPFNVSYSSVTQSTN